MKNLYLILTTLLALAAPAYAQLMPPGFSYPDAAEAAIGVTGQNINPNDVNASGVFTGNGSGLTNLTVGFISTTNPATSQTLLVGGISGTLAASATNTLSMTTVYAVNNLIIGNSPTVPSLSGKLLIRQTSDGAGLAMRVYNQTASQFTGVGMDASSIPCWYRGTACIVNLMSTGLSVNVVSNTTTTTTGTSSIGVLAVSTTTTLTGLLTANGGISATALTVNGTGIILKGVSASLAISGTAGTAPVTCGAVTEGYISYSFTNHYLCVCDGTSWKQESTIASACTF